MVRVMYQYHLSGKRSHKTELLYSCFNRDLYGGQQYPILMYIRVLLKLITFDYIIALKPSQKLV